MVDRITKVDTSWNRVQEARDNRRGRQGQPEEEGTEKDKFAQGRPFWKKLITGSAPLPHFEGRERPEELSLSVSQRLMVLWGIMDPGGKLRVLVIVSYLTVGALILISMVLIFGILWR